MTQQRLTESAISINPAYLHIIRSGVACLRGALKAGRSPCDGGVWKCPPPPSPHHSKRFLERGSGRFLTRHSCAGGGGHVSPQLLQNQISVHLVLCPRRIAGNHVTIAPTPRVRSDFSNCFARPPRPLNYLRTSFCKTHSGQAACADSNYSGGEWGRDPISKLSE